MRMRGGDSGNMWVPVFSAAAEGKLDEVYWPVGVASGELVCVICSAAAQHPKVHTPSYSHCTYEMHQKRISYVRGRCRRAGGHGRRQAGVCHLQHCSSPPFAIAHCMADLAAVY